jgi:hypothetical protein
MVLLLVVTAVHLLKISSIGKVLFEVVFIFLVAGTRAVSDTPKLFPLVLLLLPEAVVRSAFFDASRRLRRQRSSG